MAGVKNLTWTTAALAPVLLAGVVSCGGQDDLGATYEGRAVFGRGTNEEMCYDFVLA